MAGVEVIACPRCGGTWWRKEAFFRLTADQQVGPEEVEKISTGQFTPFEAHTTGLVFLYVCGDCSFPRSGWTGRRHPR